MEKDIATLAVNVYAESFRVPALKSPEDYFTRVYHECLGMFFPIFRNRTFWLRAVRLFEPKVPVRYAIQTMVKKNKLYGQRQLYLMGTLGILIRSIDKIERIRNITNGAWNELADNESVQDNYMDLFNYAILAVLVMDKKL